MFTCAHGAADLVKNGFEDVDGLVALEEHHLKDVLGDLNMGQRAQVLRAVKDVLAQLDAPAADDDAADAHAHAHDAPSTSKEAAVKMAAGVVTAGASAGAGACAGAGAGFALALALDRLSEPLTRDQIRGTSVFGAEAGMFWYKARCMSDLPDAEPRHRALFDWAYLGGWQDTLSRIVRNEYWGNGFFALTNYIQTTFLQLLRQGKVYVLGHGRGKPGAVVLFNTGLVTRSRAEHAVVGGRFVVGVLSRRQMGDGDGKQWGFMLSSRARSMPAQIENVFVTVEDVVAKDRFFGCPPPERATYATAVEDLVWNPASDADVRPDVNHLLDAGKAHFRRLPDKYHSRSMQELSSLVEGAVKLAVTELRANFRLAVPQYYRDRVQLLLPLYLESTDKAELALVLRRDPTPGVAGGEQYTVKTWLRLSWAYLNARVMAPVDQDWLKAGLNIDFNDGDDLPLFVQPRRGARAASATATAGAGASAASAASAVDVDVGHSGGIAVTASAVSAGGGEGGGDAMGMRVGAGASTSDGSAGAPDGSDGYPGVCVPYLPKDIDRGYVKDVFSSLCGPVARVDLVPKTDHYIAFVHLMSWRSTAENLRQRLLHALTHNLRDKEYVSVGDGKGWRFSASRKRSSSRRTKHPPGK